MDTIYFNNAATSWPKAPGSVEAMAASAASLPLHPGRTGAGVADPQSECRRLLAARAGISDPDRIILTTNATHSLNMALHGFPFPENAVVLTSYAEHNAILRPLYYLRKTKGLRVVFAEVDAAGRIDPQSWAALLRSHKPVFAAFTHASNVTGAVNDAALLTSLAKEAGATTLLDASQTFGCIDVQPEAWGLDMMGFTGHKYLLGPLGTGGLYIGPNADIEPIWVGGTGVLGELEEMPPDLPGRFDIGTPNSTAFAGLAAALAWAEENPMPLEAVHNRVQRLAEGLKEAGAFVVPYTGPHTPVLSFIIPDWSPDDIGEILQLSFSIVCRTGLHCAPLIHSKVGTGEAGSIRFSLSRFSTDEEVEAVLDAVRRILS